MGGLIRSQTGKRAAGFLSIFVSLLLSSLASADQPIAPEARICNTESGEVACTGDQVCDAYNSRCVDPVTAPPGHYRCADGLTTCPSDRLCNLEAKGGAEYFLCLIPGSMRCNFANGKHWCKPGTVCDDRRAMCVEPVKVPEGHKLCPGGLYTCPNDRECNPDAWGGAEAFLCLIPGSQRCKFYDGKHWCAPGTVCDEQRVMCVAAEPASTQGASNVVLKISGTWQANCVKAGVNEQSTHAGSFTLEFPSRSTVGDTAITGRLDDGSEVIPLQGIWTRSGSIKAKSESAAKPWALAGGMARNEAGQLTSGGSLSTSFADMSCTGEYKGTEVK
jgi:hypothetical protein